VTTVNTAENTILVVDGTGRGHAICDLFTRTNSAVTVYYGPGCDVIEHDRIIAVPSISLADARTVLDFLAANPVEFVFVSNIDALSRGYVDELRRAGHQVIGPTAAAAELESSKMRGKRFCLDHGIPVPAFGVFTDPAQAKAHIRALRQACVVKTDGLTPDGDGAVVCDSVAEAEAAVDRFAAGCGGSVRLLIEERLTGQEVSVFALLDGRNAMMFPLAMDYKRALDGGAGKNCDGMGSIAPHPADSLILREDLRDALIDPLVKGLQADGIHFTGFVYIGAMLTARGPAVLEINTRFGDSEAEVVLPGVRNDFMALCRAVLTGSLDRAVLATDGLARCSVALVQGCLDPAGPGALPGWPFGDFAAGQPVTGLHAVDPREAVLFYAGLRRDSTGRPASCGGRVLHVVGAGQSPDQARRRAYRQIGRVWFPGMRFRDDIGAETPRPGRRASYTGAGQSGAGQPGSGGRAEPVLARGLR
jgi:phosphoribosylamine--glycine ligase